MNNKWILLEDGFMGVSTKGSGVKPAPENPGNVIWDKNDILEMVYDVAPTIFRKSNQNWWVGTGYEEEDFTQDAALYMLEKYKEDYIDTTSPNLKKIIYSLLNNFFIFNKAKSFKRKRMELSLDSVKDSSSLPHLGGSDTDDSYMGLVADEALDPEEQALLSNAIKNGKKLVKLLIDSFSVIEFSSRKYTYNGVLNGKPLKFSEQTIAKLFLSGKTTNQILQIFNINKSTNPNGAITVVRKTKLVINKLAELINSMSEDERFDIKAYLYNINKNIQSFPPGYNDGWRREYNIKKY